MKTQYRLLNEGEVIQEGDEYWSGTNWMPCTQEDKFADIGCIIDDTFLPRRRPIKSPWIAIKDRRPTEQDGSILLMNVDPSDHCPGRHQVMLSTYGTIYDLKWEKTVYWMPIPQLPKNKEPQPYDGFDDWLNTLPGNSLFHEETLRRMAYVAGREYEKSRQ